MRIDNPSAETLDLIDDDTLVEVLSDRRVVLPVSLEPQPEDPVVQVARERRILRLLPRVSRDSG